MSRKVWAPGRRIHHCTLRTIIYQGTLLHASWYNLLGDTSNRSQGYFTRGQNCTLCRIIYYGTPLGTLLAQRVHLLGDTLARFVSRFLNCNGNERGGERQTECQAARRFGAWLDRSIGKLCSKLNIISFKLRGPARILYFRTSCHQLLSVYKLAQKTKKERKRFIFQKQIFHRQCSLSILFLHNNIMLL